MRLAELCGLANIPDALIYMFGMQSNAELNEQTAATAKTKPCT